MHVPWRARLVAGLEAGARRLADGDDLAGNVFAHGKGGWVGGWKGAGSGTFFGGLCCVWCCSAVLFG